MVTGHGRFCWTGWEMGYGDMGHLILIANEHLRATEYMNTYPHYQGVKFIQKCLSGPPPPLAQISTHSTSTIP